MSSVAQAVAQLETALASHANEHELRDLVGQMLRELRATYREKKAEFTAEVVAFLKEVAAVESVLSDFIDALQDKELVRTYDDAQELASRFHEIAKRLAPHLVSRRAGKEVRELIEKSKILPFATLAKADADYRRRVARLDEQAPICPNKRHDKMKMVLRESEHGLFWGCRSFPQCFAKRWLTKKETAALSGDC